MFVTPLCLADLKSLFRRQTSTSHEGRSARLPSSGILRFRSDADDYLGETGILKTIHTPGTAMHKAKTNAGR